MPYDEVLQTRRMFRRSGCPCRGGVPRRWARRARRCRRCACRAPRRSRRRSHSPARAGAACAAQAHLRPLFTQRVPLGFAGREGPRPAGVAPSRACQSPVAPFKLVRESPDPLGWAPSQPGAGESPEVPQGGPDQGSTQVRSRNCRRSAGRRPERAGRHPPEPEVELHHQDARVGLLIPVLRRRSAPKRRHNCEPERPERRQGPREVPRHERRRLHRPAAQGSRREHDARR
jgi:hypothetical protein